MLLAPPPSMIRFSAIFDCIDVTKIRPFWGFVCGRLPQVVHGLAVETEGTLPAVAATGALDEGEHVGRDGAVAAVVFVVGGAAGLVDQVVLDVAAGLGGHVVVEVEHADGHRHRRVVAEEVAHAVVGSPVAGADTGGDAGFRVYILAHLPAQASCVSGTSVVEAAEIVVVGFLAEQLFFVFHHR